MINWLKEKIFGRLRYWFSEQIARAYQESHTQRLQEMAKNLPQELMRINKVLAILNNNNWAVYHLFKKARNKNQHANAFLYFFYFFELNLKHLIISEMNTRNMNVALSNIKNGLNFFSLYKENELLAILDLGPTGKVIEKFLTIFPESKIKNDLWKINNERTYIIHNMLKKEMSEIDIEQSFEKFFQKSETAIKNTLKEFDSILVKRPQDLLEQLTKVMKSKDRT